MTDALTGAAVALPKTISGSSSVQRSSDSVQASPSTVVALSPAKAVELRKTLNS